MERVWIDNLSLQSFPHPCGYHDEVLTPSLMGVFHKKSMYMSSVSQKVIIRLLDSFIGSFPRVFHMASTRKNKLPQEYVMFSMRKLYFTTLLHRLEYEC